MTQVPDYDVAIIGGGFTGLSAAYELARAGKKSSFSNRRGKLAASRRLSMSAAPGSTVSTTTGSPMTLM